MRGLLADVSCSWPGHGCAQANYDFSSTAFILLGMNIVHGLISLPAYRAYVERVMYAIFSLLSVVAAEHTKSVLCTSQRVMYAFLPSSAITVQHTDCVMYTFLSTSGRCCFLFLSGKGQNVQASFTGDTGTHLKSLSLYHTNW